MKNLETFIIYICRLIFVMSQVKQRKVALMGYRSVGKSSLAIQFVQGQFVDAYDPTIENTFNKMLKVGCNFLP